MATLVLNIPNEQDINWLVPMLKRLGIGIAEEKALKTSKNLAYHQNIVAKGGKDKENFDEYIASFNENRKDRSLPFRDWPFEICISLIAI